MRFQVIFTALLFNALNGIGQEARLYLTVENIHPSRGHLMLRIMDASSKTVHERRVAAKSANWQVEEFRLAAGIYAVQVYQDKNDNLKLDRPLGGPPTERYGFSNNARGTFGPPEISEQLFHVQGSTRHKIRID